MADTYDERQLRLRQRTYTWAFGTLVATQGIALTAEVISGHAFFASATLLFAVPLIAICGGLLATLIATDAYLTARSEGFLPVLALLFWLLAAAQGGRLWQTAKRGLLDPLWRGGQVASGILPWLLLVVAVGLAVTTTVKALEYRPLTGRLMTPTRLAVAGGWLVMLGVTLTVRAGKQAVHTPVSTTVSNYVMMAVPLLLVDGLVHHHRRLAFAFAWAWALLMGYLQLFH